MQQPYSNNRVYVSNADTTKFVNKSLLIYLFQASLDT